MIDPAIVDLARLYENRFAAQERAAKDRIWKVLCDDFFSQFVKPSDTVLDIACGYGEFINHIGGRSRIAVDLNPDAAAYLVPEVRFVNASCEDLGFLEDGCVDIAFESNFFEHVPDKGTLRRIVEEVFRKMRSGGRFIMMQPNILHVGHAYWDFYDHVLPLSHLSCSELLLSCGFTVESVIPRFLPYTTKSRIPQHPFLVRLYLRFPVLWRILGKQFLIVARKP